jgi:diaminohydroxyphosphoribosylaminopyrimidine deaminase/5-amino-6-(5-phosphoribosylamino)uracil reductase
MRPHRQVDAVTRPDRPVGEADLAADGPPAGRNPACLDLPENVDPGARLFKGEGKVLVATASRDAERIAALRHVGAELIELPDEHGKVDLIALLKELARRHVNEVHVEAGFRLNGSLVKAGIVDELLVYLAPMLIGEAQGMVHLPALADLTQAQRLQFREVTSVGEDVRILARLI